MAIFHKHDSTGLNDSLEWSSPPSFYKCIGDHNHSPAAMLSDADQKQTFKRDRWSRPRHRHYSQLGPGPIQGGSPQGTALHDSSLSPSQFTTDFFLLPISLLCRTPV